MRQKIEAEPVTGTGIDMFTRTAKRSFVTVVHQAEFAYREFLGYNRVKLEPGLRLNLPLLHSIRRINMREAMISIPELSVYTKDNVPVKIAGCLFFKPLNAEKLCYEVDNYKSAISVVGQSSFRAVIGRFEFDEIIADRNRINGELIHVLENSTEKWGITCTRCEIQHFGPQNTNVAQQLEKQMDAERRRRENELDTQAHIRTAEGEKQKAILVSQGELEAAKNRATAMKYEMDLQAQAIADQVRILSKEIGNPSTASDVLLEMKRLEHLKSIANGQNRVYFIDPQKAFPASVVPLADTLDTKQLA